MKLTAEKRNGMLEMYSDFHKDAYGFRPRWDYSSLSDEQLVSDFERFQRDCDENAKWEAMALEINLKAWDELVNKTIQMGAGDYPTALRWIFDGYEGHDPEYVMWNHGILYSDKGRTVINEICEIYSKMA